MGALGAMLGGVLAERYPGTAPQFEPVGKPYAPNFAAAEQATGKAVMLGDQLATGIMARLSCIDSALLLGGLGRWPIAGVSTTPDCLLSSLKR